MTVISNQTKGLLLAAMLTVPMTGLAAQQDEGDSEVLTTVYGTVPVEGPDVEGIISARNDEMIQVTTEAGTTVNVAITDNTEIRATGGFLGLNRTKLGADSLLNGLPVEISTLQAGERLLAERIKFKNDDLEMAAMIRNGTAQRFAEQRVDIDANTRAAEALRSRMGDIDNYNIKGTTNVYFDTGKWNLSPEAEANLCNAAAEADSMDNALLLVVGYTDDVGDQDYNQVLSERRAGRVVNYLQQACGWKPWRMLTPTGMSESDPLADNSTPEGRAQNRRVSVNILVSKATEEG